MKVLHLLLNEPDETVTDLIPSVSGRDGTTVVCLYPDSVTGTPVNWNRVVEDVMAHDRTICWW